MAGSGYHPEGHNWELYEWRSAPSWAKWICRTCAEVAREPHQETECIDDC